MENALSEKTYFKYRDEVVHLIESPELINHLEKRYECKAFQLNNKIYPVTVLWKNDNEYIHPDAILGQFDKSEPHPLEKSPLFEPEEYKNARSFIKEEFEKGPIKYEGIHYSMQGIDISTNPAKINGAYCLYYDNILTQYAMEWELKKALKNLKLNTIDLLFNPDILPLREALEEKIKNPIFNGKGRSAALSISTLLVFKKDDGKFWFILHKRSSEVGVSPKMQHVVPSGMFEAKDLTAQWSIETNIWRELLEELYNKKEFQGSGKQETQENIKYKKPIKLLREMIVEGSAELCVTGICSDLLSMRPEICTIIFVKDSSFASAKKMKTNWEIETDIYDKVAKPYDLINETIEDFSTKGNIAVTAPVCIQLGRNWIAQRHGIGSKKQ
ncbi:MAG: hypothetical protein JXA16_15030 [Bacteroidales bacterium]|nr:hypothetical protein [Bacteroidales bacterium]